MFPIHNVAKLLIKYNLSTYFQQRILALIESMYIEQITLISQSNYGTVHSQHRTSKHACDKINSNQRGVVPVLLASIPSVSHTVNTPEQKRCHIYLISTIFIVSMCNVVLGRYHNHETTILFKYI